MGAGSVERARLGRPTDFSFPFVVGLGTPSVSGVSEVVLTGLDALAGLRPRFSGTAGALADFADGFAAPVSA